MKMTRECNSQTKVLKPRPVKWRGFFMPIGEIMSNEKLTLTVEEIVQLTQLGRDHTKKLIRDGVLPNVGNAKRFLVPRTAVIRYLENAGQK
jgi:excisionase family DNA binding protein